MNFESDTSALALTRTLDNSDDILVFFLARNGDLFYADAHMYVGMATKNISIREDVYKKLLSAKRDEESFSDAIDRLLAGKTNLLSFAGIFSKDDEEVKTIEREIRKIRKSATFRVSSL